MQERVGVEGTSRDSVAEVLAPVADVIDQLLKPGPDAVALQANHFGPPDWSRVCPADLPEPVRVEMIKWDVAEPLAQQGVEVVDPSDERLELRVSDVAALHSQALELREPPVPLGAEVQPVLVARDVLRAEHRGVPARQEPVRVHDGVDCPHMRWSRSSG